MSVARFLRAGSKKTAGRRRGARAPLDAAALNPSGASHFRELKSLSARLALVPAARLIARPSESCSARPFFSAHIRRKQAGKQSGGRFLHPEARSSHLFSARFHADLFQALAVTVA